MLLVIAGCNTSKGVETRTIEPEPMESVTMQLATDGERLVVNVGENNMVTVHRYDEEGNLIESVDGTAVVNDNGTFEISVTFSDGTTAIISGKIDEDGRPSDIHLYIDGKEEDASVSLEFEDDTSTQPKAATPKIVKVSVGESETLALDEDGNVHSIEDDDEPEVIFSNVSDISSGDDFSCILTTNHRVRCWNVGGRNDLTTINSGTAIAIETSGSNVCVTNNNDSTWCWNSLELNKPIAMFDRVIKASISEDEICALVLEDRGNKKIRCKDLTTNTIKVINGSNVADIVSGGHHHCVLTNTGNVRCWGDNSEGQLGITQGSNRTAPTDIEHNIWGSELRASANHTCILNDGDIFCWGREADKSNTNEPRETSSQTEFIDFDAGNRQNCAVDIKGDVWCWTGTTQPTKIQF